MDSNQPARLVTLLKAGITEALTATAQDHVALETLSLAPLRTLAASDADGLESLRRYLAALPTDATQAGTAHMAAASVVLAGHSGNAAALGAGESTVIASILPSEPSDDELRGKV